MLYKLKSYNYSELAIVNVADIWRESDVWYQGRSRQQAETEYETCSNNEWREVSRGHSTKAVATTLRLLKRAVSSQTIGRTIFWI